MSYHQKMKAFIDDDNEEGLTAWMKAQPLTEQLAIAETLKEVVAELLKDEDSTERTIILSRLDNLMEDYVDKNLDCYNATVAYEKAVEERDKAFVVVCRTSE